VDGRTAMSTKPENKNLLVILSHIVVIIFAYTSPFWLDWRLVAAGIILYYIQIAIFGGCILSLAQFKGEKISFHEWYLTKWGVGINRAKLKFFLDRVLPFIFLALALSAQLIFNVRPWVKL
jgi:hypothetical protein